MTSAPIPNRHTIRSEPRAVQRPGENGEPPPRRDDRRGCARRSRHRDACATATWNFRSKALTTTTFATPSPTRAGGGRAHEALDIMAPRGHAGSRRRGRRRSRSCSTARAAAALTIYQFDPSRPSATTTPTSIATRPDLAKDRRSAAASHRLRRQHRQRVGRRASPALRDLSADARASMVEGRADQSVPGSQVEATCKVCAPAT